MDNYDVSKMKMRVQLAGYMMLAQALNGGSPDTLIPKLPEPKPKGYGVHLSKAERRGKSLEELQALRAERRPHG